MSVENVTPYNTDERKREQIARAFDALARRYDRLNRILSLGLDVGWRRRALAHARLARPARLLDVATGTADFALEAARQLPGTGIVGIDLSEEMLRVGRRKVANAGLAQRVELRLGDALALEFGDASFDVVTVAFGVRNFERLPEGLAELRRVLRPGGLLLVLELAEPEGALLRPLSRLYLRGCLPRIGRALTGLAAEYRYLPASIASAPQGEAMLALMRGAGLTDCAEERYAFGLCRCYVGRAGG